MKCKRKIGLLLIICMLICVWALSFGIMPNAANADEVAPEETDESGENDIEPQALILNLQVNISGSESVITGEARNVFTLFSTTVQVYIMLYRSAEYQESYSGMTFVAQNYIYDLDQGDTVTVSAATGGASMWWVARMRYKNGSKDWDEKVTSAVRFDGYGNVLEVR